MVLQNTGKYRADKNDFNKKEAGSSSGPRFFNIFLTAISNS